MLDQNTSTNSQAQAATPVPPAGPTMEELNARLQELEKQSEGRLRDLQEERRKRQELEQRIAVAPAPAAENAAVPTDELAKVLNPYIAPVVKEVEMTKKELEALRLEKAQNYLASKTGKKWESIESDRDFQEKLIRTANKYGISGNIYDRTVRAYELMELENLRAKEEERIRASQVNQTVGMPNGTPSAPTAGQKEYSAEEFNRMPLSDFDVLSQKGDFKKDPSTGRFTYVPRS